METSNIKSPKPLVLMVDDVPRNLQVLGSILRQEDCEIAAATNGAQALKFVENILPDLILLDVMMPEIDGFEVCKRLKQDERTKNIPVIFLTAKTDSDSIVQGFNLGAVDYVTKPFKGVELLARVKTHLKLKRTENQLRELIATKDKFFSIVAHDLKNPFNTFLMGSEYLLTRFHKLSEEKILKYIGSINDSANRLFDLLTNLLQWARSQTGRIQYKPHDFDLSSVSLEIISILAESAKEKNLELLSKLQKPTLVHADKNMISTVIRNLVSNAIKFTEKGQIVISSEEKKDFLEISISDTGTGLSEEDIKKLFRIDVHYTTIGTSSEKGTGLGLILCKEFVEVNGGKIWVESELGKGSTFKFTLPKS